jgi:hypothetical protein
MVSYGWWTARLPSSYHFCSANLQIKENDAGAAGLKTKQIDPSRTEHIMLEKALPVTVCCTNGGGFQHGGAFFFD